MRSVGRVLATFALVVLSVFATEVPSFAGTAVVDCSQDPEPADCAQPLTADEFQQGVADLRWVLVTGFGLLMMSGALVAVVVARRS